ncbi:type III secretion system ATPase, FliI/YscN [Geoalkalibacter ferrihydriticus]|uniref:ATP synthase n=2 Tax=Geoalkalibacter ferrihydriticus TaxID=392333 RepID=A0A0C2HXT9_9BACT|nr:FliI/YscN family ATPase [Geoalkalibacter ferrihydriticus]KIH77567.1 ATP synthase [Geoalkalibacter ferrihydriticus DSM 17813]SDL68445.1 type III secretion system ATPase, FliI/YscN [Geoalkalibacter ferrihydriticus]
MEALLDSIRAVPALRVLGKVTRIVGLIVEGSCPQASVGTLCEIQPLDGGPGVPAEVVGFRDSQALLMPLGELRGLGPGSLIRVRRSSATLAVHEGLLGRVIGAMGEPLDGGPALTGGSEMPLYSLPPGPMERKKIEQPLDLGVRSINALLTSGLGQRMGIMAGSGVGKSVLLGMMAKHARADVNVIALIGERGREVMEFMERDLGPEGLARSVVVVATSDQSPLLRMRGAFVATTVAEYFCGQGAEVLLMMDSVTRFAMAMREVGLAVGEPPTTKGYTPSVFATLPKLLERAGSFRGRGSITGLYTVLVEGDDMNEPIADSVRSILDGHIVLSRALAAKNHYPCIDILASASRVMRDIISADHLKYAGQVREILATYKEAEDLVNIGAYAKGSNAKIDYALTRIDAVIEFLRQSMDEKVDLETTLAEMEALVLDRRKELR